jgi:hypothetical protein
VSNLKANFALAIGYLLIYAAVFSAGKHALRPWGALSE